MGPQLGPGLGDAVAGGIDAQRPPGCHPEGSYTGRRRDHVTTNQHADQPADHIAVDQPIVFVAKTLASNGPLVRLRSSRPSAPC